MEEVYRHITRLGYFYREGKLFRKNGVELRSNRRLVSVTHNKKKYDIRYARVVLYLNNKLDNLFDPEHCIEYLDGDKDNIMLDNITLFKLGSKKYKAKNITKSDRLKTLIETKDAKHFKEYTYITSEGTFISTKGYEKLLSIQPTVRQVYKYFIGDLQKNHNYHRVLNNHPPSVDNITASPYTQIKICSVCGLVCDRKDITEHFYRKSKLGEYASKCKPCFNYDNYTEENKKIIDKFGSFENYKNSEEYKNAKKEREIKKKLKHNIRDYLRRLSRKINKPFHYYKPNKLPYGMEQLKQRLEMNFDAGMSWDNYGEWEIDHTKPIDAFKPGIKIEIVNSLCNIRPLWKSDNGNKSSLWDIRLVRKYGHNFWRVM